MESAQIDTGLSCCSCEDKSMDQSIGLTCADKKNIFTRREQEVLDRIREASHRAGELKAKIKSANGHGNEAAALELEQLRQMRADLEKERIDAAEERMRLLGHA